MIRDQLRYFEDSRFPQLLVQLEQWSKPETPAPSAAAPEATAKPSIGEGMPPASTTATKAASPEPKLVPARTIKVSYPRPWLTNKLSSTTT